VSRSGYKSEILAARLSDGMRSSLLGGVFDSRGWMLQAPPAEVAQMLLALKLVRRVDGDFQITIAGMGVRATLARQVHTKRS
jgi:hypothetical protein